MSYFKFPEAVVMYANYATLSFDHQISAGPVQSRMFLWCTAGHGGHIRINDGELLSLQPGEFVFLPFLHKIDYFAQYGKPFHVAGIHLIPRLPRGGNVNFFVYHFPVDNAEYFQRHDLEVSELPDVMRGKMVAESSLNQLAHYIIAAFQPQERNEEAMRLLAELFLNELIQAYRHQQSEIALPAELQKMLRFIEDNRTRTISIEELAEYAGYSPSTVFRLFRRYQLGTPKECILRCKLELAATLLAGCDLPIKEICEKIGVDDYYYFFKLFQKYHHSTPGEYRKHHRL